MFSFGPNQELTDEIARLQAKVAELTEEITRQRITFNATADNATIIGDSNLELRAEVDELRKELAAARKETIHSVQCVADWISQQTYGTRIYNAAPTLPEHKQEPDLIERRVQARRVCDEMEREFFEKYQGSDE